MNPAASVIVFTVLSGAGYGLWFWTGLLGLLERRSLSPDPVEAGAIGLGLLLVAVGLFSSLAHLGQPQRAWRALGQWRSSWLSREGLFAVLAFAPAVGLLLAWLFPPSSLLLVALRGALLLLSAATVFATAMIYASLRPIPAWRLPHVVPAYLLFSLLSGGALLALIQSAIAGRSIGGLALIVALLAMSLGILKSDYWRRLDRSSGLPRRSLAVGLPAGADVSPWEDPHTESSFITREMVFVLARKHRQRLRTLSIVGVVWLPLGLLPVAWWLPAAAPLLLGAVLISTLSGALVERWLFFAEARHAVSVYFR